MKKIFSLILIFTMLTGVSAFAENTAKIPTASVVFEANEPDSDGYFTAVISVYNAEYIGFQGALFYNKDAVEPVSFETKQPTDKFSDAVRIATKAKSLTTDNEITWLSEIWTEIHKDEGYITFANYTAIGQEKPNSILNENGYIVAGDDGLKIYEFSFRKISDKDACFELYQNERKDVGVIVSSGYENPDVKVTVKQPDSISKEKTEDSLYHYEKPVMVSDESEDSPLTIEQRKLVRASKAVFLNIDNYGAVSDGKLMWIDKNDKTVVPYIKDSRTFVPLRFIAEQLGAEVSFDDGARLITIKFDGKTLEMKLGARDYTIDGEKKEMDTESEILSDRTFVPLRAVAEAFDKNVTWLDSDRIVVVTSKTYPWAEDNKIEKELLQEIKLMISPMVRDFAYMNEK